jgi:hypothetical protein
LNTIRTALLQRIAAEAGKEFLGQLEERLTAKFTAAVNYVNQNFSPELRPSMMGQLQNSHILNEVVEAGIAAGLSSTMAPTNPKGHHYAKIVTDSFMLGCMRMKSLHWSAAKYSKDLGQLNAALEPMTPDLFDTVVTGDTSNRIFVVAAVIEHPDSAALPMIFFAVPYSTLSGFHLMVSLDEVREAAANEIDMSSLDPLPTLIKRLDEAERGTQEAEG